jgi:cell division protein FtsI (penicillin-binding protein 3)
MMETVVSPKGTAKQAVIEGYSVAGKTGTAKKSAGRGGYAAGRYQAVFAGMAPAKDPRFVLVVMVDEPGAGKYYGGLVAAPAFARIMQGALRLFNVPPDHPEVKMLMASADAAR